MLAQKAGQSTKSGGGQELALFRETILDLINKLDKKESRAEAKRKLIEFGLDARTYGETVIILEEQRREYYQLANSGEYSKTTNHLFRRRANEIVDLLKEIKAKQSK